MQTDPLAPTRTPCPFRHELLAALTLLLLVSLGLAPSAVAQDREGDADAVDGLGALHLLRQTTNLLGGRLVARFPVRAATEFHAHVEPDAPGPSESETRVTIDADNGARLVLSVHELAATAGDGFVEQATAMAERWGSETSEVEAVKSAIGPSALVAIAGTFDVSAIADAESDGAQGPARGLILRHTDGTVQSLYVSINAVAARDLAGTNDLIDRILATLDVGERTLDLSERDVAIGGLTAHVPEGYAVTVYRGMHLASRFVKRAINLGDFEGSLDLHTGDVFLSSNAGDEGVIEIESSLFDQDVTWFRVEHTTDAGASYLTQETLMRDPSYDDHQPPNYNLRLFIRAESEEDVAAYQAIAESLRVQ